MIEDEQFRDEPLSGNPDMGPDDWDYYDHIYTYNLPETRENCLIPMYQLIKDYSLTDGYDRFDLRKLIVVNSKKMKFINCRVDFLETSPDLPIQDNILFYECSDYPFNFQFISMPLNASTFAASIDEWIQNVPSDSAANWVVCT